MSSTKLIISIPFFLSLLLRFSSAKTAVKATYWFAESESPVTAIDSSLFTHLFCAFADINTLTYQVIVSSRNKPKFSTFTQTVQRRNPTVRTLLSIGGDFTYNFAFASMASNPTSRKLFIASSINLARSYGFHGLDLYWKYPSTTTEMDDFGKLLQEWRWAVIAAVNRVCFWWLRFSTPIRYCTRFKPLPIAWIGLILLPMIFTIRARLE